MSHCENNSADRAIGSFWEKKFAIMMVEHGFLVSMHQYRKEGSAIATCRLNGAIKTFTLPDTSVWDAPGFDCEIKHKDPTNSGCFGLEEYRLEALVDFAGRSGREVHYTIHNYALCPGETRLERKNYAQNHISHWVTVHVMKLWEMRTDPVRMPSYVNGKKKDGVPTYLWPIDIWQPLNEYLASYGEAA